MGKKRTKVFLKQEIFVQVSANFKVEDMSDSLRKFAVKLTGKNLILLLDRSRTVILLRAAMSRTGTISIS